ncbi:MAG: hypothetical protein KI790_18170 [Cyclobacteriaceae bacterium]|nr:hypothetical protein [Cyclobacteriaceae bacterium HetDA_MAG_MS6]
MGAPWKAMGEVKVVLGRVNLPMGGVIRCMGRNNISMGGITNPWDGIKYCDKTFFLCENRPFACRKG